MNSTTESQGGFDTAHGIFVESMLIAPQQGTAQGDPGTLHLFYHLDGTVNINVGLAPDSQGNSRSFGRVAFGWGFFAGASAASKDLVSLGVTQQNAWLGNQVSAVVNLDVDVPIHFQFGVPFYYATEFRLEAGAGAPEAPSTGFAEGDFSHTGTLLGGASSTSSEIASRTRQSFPIPDSTSSTPSQNPPSPNPPPSSCCSLGPEAGWG